MENISTTISTTLSKEGLLAAVIKFRDSLPVDHNRRERLKDVNDLRFDTKDSTICYLLEPTGECLRRIDRSQPVDTLAESLVLYPAHTVIILDVSPADVTRLATLKRGSMQTMSLGGIQASLFVPSPLSAVRDIFITDTPGRVIIHIEESIDADTAMELINDELARQTDEIKYMARKLIRTISQSIMNGKTRETGLDFGIGLDRGFVWQVQLLALENGEQLAKLKHEVKAILDELRIVLPENQHLLIQWIRGSLSEIFPSIWSREPNIQIHSVQTSDPVNTPDNSAVDAPINPPDNSAVDTLIDPMQPAEPIEVNPPIIPADRRPDFPITSLTDIID
jgi:hypothetical protein